MHLAGHAYAPISFAEADCIHQGALRILESTSMVIEHASRELLG